MESSFGLFCCLWVACFLGCQSVVLRIRHSDGRMRRVCLPQQSNFGDLYDALVNSRDVPVSDTDKIQLRHQFENVSTLKGNGTKLSEARILDGEVLSIESRADRKDLKTPYLGSTLLRLGTQKANKRRKVKTLADFEKEKSLLVKITRQEPDENFSVDVSDGIASWLRNWKNMAKAKLPVTSCVLLFGKDGAGGAERTKLTEIQAGVEVNLDDVSGDVSDSSSVILEKAVAVGRKMGLAVVGCCWESGRFGNPPPAAPEAARTGRAARGRQVTRGVRSGEDAGSAPDSPGSDLHPKDVRIALSLLSASRTITGNEQRPFVLLLCDVESTGSNDNDEDERIKFEAFHFSEQALALHRRGILSAAKAPSTSPNPDPSLVALSSAVLLPNAVESTQVDGQLLVVPVRIRASSAADSGRWVHAFPSLVEMQRSSEPLQRSAQQYLRRILDRVVQKAPGSAEWVDAVSRLRDVNLLLYLSLLLDEAVLDELCAHLLAHPLTQQSPPGQEGRRSATALSPPVLLSLEQLLSRLPADP